MATALKDLYGSGTQKFDQLQLAEDYRPSEAEVFMNPHHQAYFLAKLKGGRKRSSMNRAPPWRSSGGLDDVAPTWRIALERNDWRSNFAPATASAS